MEIIKIIRIFEIHKVLKIVKIMKIIKIFESGKSYSHTYLRGVIAIFKIKGFLIEIGGFPIEIKEFLTKVN